MAIFGFTLKQNIGLFKTLSYERSQITNWT